MGLWRIGWCGIAAKGMCGEVGVQAEMEQEQKRIVAEKNRALEVRQMSFYCLSL